MESKFGDILDGQLINLVKANPVLYQRSHENYKDNATKENIWEQIALSLEKSVSECKTRWRTIRDSYRKNKKKIKIGCKAGSFWLPKSKYNNENLKFLDESLKERGLEEATQITNDKFDGEECHDSVESTDRIKEISSTNTETHSNKDTDDRTVRNDATHAEPGGSFRKKVIKRPHIASESNSAEELIHKKYRYKSKIDTVAEEIKKVSECDNIKNDSLWRKNTENAVEHPIETFFRSMATTVMSFPPHLIAKTRMQVCNIVSKMELRSIMEQNKQPHQSANQSLGLSYMASIYSSSHSPCSSHPSTPTGSQNSYSPKSHDDIDE